MLIKIIATTLLTINYLQASSSIILLGGIEDLALLLRMLSIQPSRSANFAAPTIPPSQCQELNDDDETPAPIAQPPATLPSSVAATPKRKLTRKERSQRAVRRAVRKELKFRRDAYRRYLLEEESEKKTENLCAAVPVTELTGSYSEENPVEAQFFAEPTYKKICSTAVPASVTEFYTGESLEALTQETSIASFLERKKLTGLGDYNPRKFTCTVTIDPSQFFVKLPTVANPCRSLVAQSTALCGYESPGTRKEYLGFFNGDKSRAAMQRHFESFLDVAKTKGFSGVADNFSLRPYTRSNGEIFEIRLNDFNRIMFRRGPNGEVIIMPGVQHHKQQDRH